MSINPNDPRLTAYALGELDERERIAFEAEMDAEAHAEVAAIRQAAESLQAELAAEPLPSLEPEQVTRIAEAAVSNRRPMWKWTAAVAATLLVGASLWAVTTLGITGASEATPAPSVRSWSYAEQPEAAVEEPAAVRLRNVLAEGLRESLRDQLARPESAQQSGQRPAEAPQDVRQLNVAAGLEDLERLASAQPRSGGDQFFLGVARGTQTAAPGPSSPEGKATVGLDASRLLAAARANGLVPVTGQAASSSQLTERQIDILLAATRIQGFVPSAVQPDLRGLVSVVDPTGRLVTLNVTENPGGAAILPGHSFAVYSGNEYKGEAVVTSVEDNFAFARIEARPGATPIAVGDRAATRTGEVIEVFNTEGYDRIVENPFLEVNVADTSTFSIDVDTASYANVRRFLNQDRLPPPDAVRIEELINYFQYDYAPPGENSEHPFRAHVEIASCPWNPAHRLARIGLQGKTMPFDERPPMNLVFLIDVSGSMSSANKLSLVKQSMSKLASELLPSDQIAIVVYAGAAGLVLDTTPGNEREKILGAINRLSAGGSTNGGQGIQLAYDTAVRHFIKDGVNRVILATDGDFNVGISDQGSLLRMIEDKAKSGVFLSVLGFGMGNYKDDLLEKLSNSGNGNYAYIDSLDEACRVLVDGVGGTLITIAKDVKVQIFFNPAHVAGYRLIGYENRMLEKQDFNDDTKDAGEIGVGHNVTALYEIVPAGGELPGPKVDQNPFVNSAQPSPVADSDAWFRLRMRYKQPEGETSTLLEEDAADGGVAFDKASGDFQWAAAVAGFGMLLRKSQYSGNMTLDGVLEIAGSSVGIDLDGSRDEFLRLVRQAREISNR